MQRTDGGRKCEMELADVLAERAAMGDEKAAGADGFVAELLKQRMLLGRFTNPLPF